MVVGVQGQIGFDPLETRDHAGERAHVLAETRNRGRRRNAAVSAARHDHLAAGAKLDRRRRTAGIAQLLAAAGRTLRAGRHVMLHDGRAQQVEADDVIAQFRASPILSNVYLHKLDYFVERILIPHYTRGDTLGIQPGIHKDSVGDRACPQAR